MVCDESWSENPNKSCHQRVPCHCTKTNFQQHRTSTYLQTSDNGYPFTGFLTCTMFQTKPNWKQNYKAQSWAHKRQSFAEVNIWKETPLQSRVSSSCVYLCSWSSRKTHCMKEIEYTDQNKVQTLLVSWFGLPMFSWISVFCSEAHYKRQGLTSGSQTLERTNIQQTSLGKR